MDELQGERKDPAQDSGSGLLVSSADVDSFVPIDIPLPVVNGMLLLMVFMWCAFSSLNLAI